MLTRISVSARERRLPRLRLADPRDRRAPQLFRPRRMGAACARPQEHRGRDRDPTQRAACARAAETETDPERRNALLTFVVIGGGPTGVEMAGAIAELARRSVSRDFRSITPHCSRVILVEAGDRVLPAFPAPLSRSGRAIAARARRRGPPGLAGPRHRLRLRSVERRADLGSNDRLGGRREGLAGRRMARCRA